MALIQINASVLCLMALLMVSTTFLSCEASGRNIGLEDATCGGYQEPYDPSPCPNVNACDHYCKQDGKGSGTCRNGACCCSKRL
ncbi:hypothetical protein CFC21_012062 [Triticum aestivum]|uniref:Knottin scorpion toxin-like domain-containing protein n=2 Tax=Triticum aestivum TaxID=4565 RepID=A0A3B5ZV45_WHEAT|nr:hypothetical protein CFC21_012062 [Triticum aestivum]